MKLKFDVDPKVQDTLRSTQWGSRASRILGLNGEVLHNIASVEAPLSWSDQAVNIVARQYFRKSLPDGTAETSVRALIFRVVDAICSFGLAREVFETKQDAQNFADHLTSLIIDQRASFNSPVWFNCGLWQSYKVVGNPGNWAWDFDEDRAVPMQNGFERPQSSACFIQSIDDDLNSIFDLVKKEARLFKYGSGSGTNFSKIRGRQETLSGGGASSGLMSFLEVFDRAAGATKSGGTTRRAAKMVCLDLDHPEILDFIRWKAKEEAKAQALIAAGFSGGMDGEAYRTVSGQNSNNSVRATDNFFEAVKSGAPWSTRARTTGHVVETFSAREVLRSIAESAWLCADPGIQYENSIQRWHTCQTTAPIRASNPCSEFMFLDDTACNLASLNLLKFLNRDGSFAIEEFKQAVRTLIVAQDLLVDFASYPSELVAENSHRYRPLGLGFANLGAALMAQGLAYDSEKSRSWAAAVTSLMTGEAYLASAGLAESQGAFEGFSENRQSMMKVIDQHRSALSAIPLSLDILASDILEASKISWSTAYERGLKHGFRNSQVTVLAPTGTIAFMMDCDTTGIEPDFALVKTKTLSGGGRLEIVNQSVSRALETFRYSKVEVESIRKKIESGVAVENSGVRTEHVDVFKCAGEISPEGHLQMMAAVQPFLSGAISKTVNLSASATVEDIEAVFLRGWELGLKAVAVYRDQSKSAQPLMRSGAGSVSKGGPKDLNRVRSFGLCSVCSYPTVVSGTCWVCPACGHSLACS